MSATIDERIVEMRFDNKHFESNVATTMSSLDKLKQGLNLKGATQGLEDIDRAAKKVDLSPISDSVDTIKLKFSPLYSFVDQIFRDMARSAEMYGKRIISAFTTDPIKQGFKEYETQINAVQTILSNTKSKGTTIDDVNGALDELNTYADKTIYNFTEMTRNIGTFTAAGVDLDTSVSAIKGIANLAAISGSSSQQASTAMYQLSQALSSGTVKLMDWNSVVNAGMGGQVFQDALKETARLHGVKIDEMIKEQGSFRETLSEGWLTSKILTETLSKFTGDLNEEQLKSMGYTEEQIKNIMELGKDANDAATKVKTFTQLTDTLKEAAQSGWSQTWEIVFGDFYEARDLFTSVSDTIGGIIGKSAEARNEMLENWKALGGRQDIIDSFKNTFDSVVSIITPIKDAFRDIFPPMTAERLSAITKGLKEFTSKLKLGDIGSENLKRTFRGLFAVADIVVQVFKSAFKAIGSLFGVVGDLGGGILGATATFGDWLVGVNEFIKSSGILDKIFFGIAKVIKVAFKGVSAFVSFIKQNFVTPGLELLRTVLDKIRDGMSGVGDAADGMKSFVVDAFDGIGSTLENWSFVKVLQGVWKIIKAIGTGAAKIFGALTKGLTNAFGEVGFDGIINLINGLISGGILVAIYKFVNGLKDISESTGGFFDGIKGIFDDVRGCLQAYQSQLKADALMKIAGAVALLAAALVVLALIDSEKLDSAVGAMTMMFIELVAALAVLTKIDAGGLGVLKLSFAMTKLATSLLILAIAMKIMSTMSWDDLTIGLVGTAAALAILISAARILPEKKVNSAASATKKMAAALVILAIAMKIMSTMSWKELAVGLTATVVGLTALVLAARFLPRDMALRSLGIMSLATAMVILSGALKIMATLSWDELLVSLTALAGSLAILTVSMNLMKKALPGAAAMFVVAPALLVLAGALKILSTMSWDSLGRGLVAFGGALILLAIGLNLMRKTIPGSVALLIASAALAVLAPVLLLLGTMKWSSIAKGLIVLAGAFAIIGVAGLLLKPIIPVIIAMAIAMALIGAGVLAAGLGLVAFGAGLSALAVGFTALVASIGAVTSGIVAIIKSVIVGIAEGIVAFCEVLASGAPVISEAIKSLVLMLIDVLVACTPKLVDTVLMLIFEILDSLVEYADPILTSLFDFIILVLKKLKDYIPKLIVVAVEIIGAIFQGIIDALKNIDIGTIVGVVLAIAAVKLLMQELASIVKLIPQALIGAVGVSAVMLLFAGALALCNLIYDPDAKSILALTMAVAIMALVSLLLIPLSAVSALVPAALAGAAGVALVIVEIAALIAAIGALAQIPGLTWLIEEGGNLLKLIGNAIGGFVGGIIGGIAAGITSALPQIGTDLAMFMTNAKPFFDGLNDINTDAIDSVSSLAKMVLILTAADILDGLTSWLTGGSSIVTFGEELAQFGPKFAFFAESIKDVNADTVTASANAALALAEMANKLPGQDGLWQKIAGEHSLATFAEELQAFGPAFKAYADSIAGIDPEVVTASANAALSLAEMAAKLPAQDGLAQWFAGDRSLTSFAEQLNDFAPAFKSYADTIKDVNPTVVTASANAATALAELANKLPKSGGIAQWFSGDQDIADFGKKLVKFGEQMKKYSDSLSGVNATRLSSTTASLVQLVNVAQGISSLNLDNLANFGNALGTMALTGITKFITAFEGSYEKVVTAGKTMITKLVSGMQSESEAKSGTYDDPADDAVAALKTQTVKDEFYNAGANLVTGFANGISANSFKAEAKAAAMASAAANAAKVALDEHSPSKVGYKIGDFFGVAFVNAVGDYVDKSYDAGYGMADSARTGLSNAISKVNSLISSDMDTQPTIRPVLDLSDVNDGARTISDLFNNGSPLGLMTNIGAVSSMMSKNGQNGTDSEMVSEIKKLRKDIGKLERSNVSINGVTYDDGSNIVSAVESIVRAAKVERRR